MTIQDMIDAGIRIQGAYRITAYNSDTTDCDTLAEGSCLEDETCDIEDDILEMEVAFIYTVVEVSLPHYPGSILVIEVEK